jgi:hypothetical protein
MYRYHDSTLQRTESTSTLQSSFWSLVAANDGRSVVPFSHVLPAANFMVAVYRMADDWAIGLSVVWLRQERAGTKGWPTSDDTGMVNAVGTRVITNCDWNTCCTAPCDIRRALGGDFCRQRSNHSRRRKYCGWHSFGCRWIVDGNDEETVRVRRLLRSESLRKRILRGVLDRDTKS